MINVTIDGVEYAPVKKSKDWEIISYFIGDNVICEVKRLSDGEIFTVGDFVESTLFPGRFFGEIKKFKIYSNLMQVFYSDDEDFGLLQNVTKKCVKKRHVLTTFDGQKIYEGDEYWSIDINEWRITGICEAFKPSKYSGYKFFSTEQAAKDFIVENKPGTLSLKDVKDILNGNTLYSNNLASAGLYLDIRNKIRKDLNF